MEWRFRWPNYTHRWPDHTFAWAPQIVTPPVHTDDEDEDERETDE